VCNILIDPAFYEIFLVIAIIFVLVFNGRTQNLINMTSSTIDMITFAKERSEFLINMNRRLRIAKMIMGGKLAHDRHEDRTGDFLSFNLMRAVNESDSMVSSNHLLRSYIHKLNKESQEKFYQKDVIIDNTIINIAGVHQNEEEKNSFDAIEQLGYIVGSYSIRDPSTLNTTDAFLNYVLKNSLNSLLISCENSITILSSYSESLRSFYVAEAYIFLFTIIILGVFLLGGVTIYNGLAFKHENDHFWDSFSKVPEHDFEALASRVKKFSELITQTELKNSAYSLNSVYKLCSIHLSSKARVKVSSQKPVKKKGLISLILKDTMIILGVILVLAVILVTFIIFGVRFNDQSQILVDRYLGAYENLIGIEMAMNAVYEYIDENGTSKILNKPIGEEVVRLLSLVSPNGRSLYSDRNGNILEQYKDILTGYLCHYADPDQMVYCLRDNVNTARGLIGAKPSYNRILSRVYNNFINSNRTTEAAFNDLGDQDLVDTETNFFVYVRPAYRYLGSIVKEEVHDLDSNFSKTSIIITVVSTILHLLVPFVIWGPISKRITQRYDKMKQILKPAPPELLYKMKGLLTYLIKISPKSLGGLKVTDFI